MALGLALLVPAPIGMTGVLTAFPFPSVFLGITAVGLLAVVFGGVTLFVILLFSDDSTLVAHPRGRAAALFATAGIFGWVLSQGFGQSAPPLAFILVTPYTAATRVTAPGMWVVPAAFTATGLALCLLGLALVRQPSRSSVSQQSV